MYFILATFVLFFCSLLFYAANRRPNARYPRGPLCFPILGNLPQLVMARRKGIHRHQLYQEYVKEYGPVFAFRVAHFRGVVINDPKLIREAWSNDQLCGRASHLGGAARTGGVIRGIVLTDGLEWREQRRFALRQLKEFGLGRKTMEQLILEEVEELIEGFKKDAIASKPITTEGRFNIAVLNSLWQIVSGERFSHDDQQLSQIMAAIQKSFDFKGWALFFPWLKDLVPSLSGWDGYVKDVSGAFNYVGKLVRRRLDRFVEGQEPNDFLDMYIQEMQKCTDKESSFYGSRGEPTLTATVADLFVAGAETTSTTLSYLCLYMAMFPEKQKKVHEEIDRVFGNTTTPSLQHRIRLAYVEATILEALRFSSMVPLGIFHKALSDVEFGGYLIPKGTFVTANLYAAHRAKQNWGDPDNFRPERFIDNNGEVAQKQKEAFLPFSVGKRVCPGESLARDELFLFFTSIMQHFSIHPDPSGVPLTLEQGFSFVVVHPKKHSLVFKCRRDVSETV